jgi:hypothetical protein
MDLVDDALATAWPGGSQRDNHTMAERPVQRLRLHYHDSLLVCFLRQQLAVGLYTLGDDGLVRLKPLFFGLSGPRASPSRLDSCPM